MNGVPCKSSLFTPFGIGRMVRRRHKRAIERRDKAFDASGTNKYTYLAGGLLYTEDGPWASDTLTNLYSNGMRTNLSLQQPTGVWTNRFGWDLPREIRAGPLTAASTCEFPSNPSVSERPIISRGGQVSSLFK